MKKLTNCLFYLQILHILSGILVHCEDQLPFPIKIATQSHTYGTSTADRAIDNNLNTCSLVAVGGGSSEYGWWQVDLGDVFKIYSVTITSGTRDGADPAYVQNFVIFTGMTNNTNYVASQLTSCYYFNNGSYLTPGIPTTFTCSPNPLYGRYVTIKRTGGFRQDALGLCDVRIFYNYTDGFIELLNLQTSQTGGYNFNGVVLDSVNANDWNLQSCSEPINDNGYPNWYIDLQDAYSVTGILAFNQDSAANFNTQPTYLSYFYVRVGNSTDLRTQTQCCYYDGVAPVGGNASCNCQTPIVGRYVSIERVNGDNPKVLVICEVFIWGYKSQDINRWFFKSISKRPGHSRNQRVRNGEAELWRMCQFKLVAMSSLSTLRTSVTRSSTLPSNPVSNMPPSSISSSSFKSYSEYNGWSSTVNLPGNTASGESHVQNCECQTPMIASIVLGILFGISVACNVFLVVNNFKLRRQHQQNPYETSQPKTSNNDQPNSYEQLRISDRSTVRTPSQHEAGQNPTQQADYEWVTSTT